MVAGHLQKKSGYYYAVLSWYKNGKKKVKWFSTGLPVEGNYKKAEEKLQQIRVNFVAPEDSDDRINPDMLFADYLLEWIEIAKARIAISTYASYYTIIKELSTPGSEKRDIPSGNLKQNICNNFTRKSLKQ